MKTEVFIAKTQDPYQGACEVLDQLGFRVTGRRVFIQPNLTGCRPSEDGMGVDTGLVRQGRKQTVDRIPDALLHLVQHLAVLAHARNP